MASYPASPSPADRRALTRQYKESRRTVGVYRIRNTVTGRSVLRGSLDLHGAMNRGRFELRLGGHRDAALQAEWRRHGEAAFAFEVLEILEHKDDPAYDPAQLLADALEAWRDRLQTAGELA